MATTYLTRTFGSPTNRKIFTWSAWVKRQNFGITENNNALFSGYLNSSVRSTLRFNTDKLNFQDTEGSVEIITNRLFRDVNAWYHIVVAVDTTQATASNRVKFYVNGEQETSFAQADYPAQNSNLLMGGNDIHYINARNASGSVDSIDDMCYSHIHFTDGTAYDASYFGSTDSTTGEWQINTSPSVTYGNNGFFILKDGNSVTDQSGNSNNWTVGGGTLTNTEDCPSNVFATWNPLDGYVSHMVFSNGNNTVDFGSTNTTKSYPRSTIGVASGKWYFEVLNVVNTNGQSVGITDRSSPSTTHELGYDPYEYAYLNNGDLINNSSSSSYANTYTSSDIIGVALDLDNNKLYFSKNGTWQNSGDPTSGATGTGAISITAPSSTNNGFYFFAVGEYSGTQNPTWSANFGNGYFGTTAVSSAGTNASGIGIFEYDVPTGYTALSTKGLNL